MCSVPSGMAERRCPRQRERPHVLLWVRWEGDAEAGLSLRKWGRLTSFHTERTPPPAPVASVRREEAGEEQRRRSQTPVQLRTERDESREPPAVGRVDFTPANGAGRMVQTQRTQTPAPAFLPHAKQNTRRTEYSPKEREAFPRGSGTARQRGPRGAWASQGPPSATSAAR